MEQRSRPAPEAVRAVDAASTRRRPSAQAARVASHPAPNQRTLVEASLLRCPEQHDAVRGG